MAGSGTAHLRGENVLLRAEHLVVEFGSGRSRVRAVSDVSFDLAAGETLGLVGESGCGKSTTGRAVALIHNPDSGSVKFDGTELTRLSRSELRQARTKIQMVFQDPISSLNPRRRVLDAVIEPLAVWGVGTKAERKTKARATLDAVGIDPDDSGGRRPIEMSGGQCQRVSIARALMLDPTILVCDEPVSALDVSVQAQILNLLDDLKRDRGLTMVFIAHDLAVVKNVSDRVAVMYLGKLCEVARPDDLYHHPEHPYTARPVDVDPRARPRGGAATARPRSPVTCPRPSTRRRDAGSGPVAPWPSRGAPTRSRRCAPSAPTISWRATSRSGPILPPPSPPPPWRRLRLRPPPSRRRPSAPHCGSIPRRELRNRPPQGRRRGFRPRVAPPARPRRSPPWLAPRPKDRPRREMGLRREVRLRRPRPARAACRARPHRRPTPPGPRSRA